MVPERLKMAADAGAIIVDNRGEQPVYDRLLELTGGIGPDVCIDAVGMEAHGSTALETAYDKIKTNLFMETERPARAAAGDQLLPQGRDSLDPRRLWRGLRQDPHGRAYEQGLTIKTGQTHVTASCRS
jgi:threonine dehydrogenase-like Zn-dependent dehydrogenase